MVAASFGAPRQEAAAGPCDWRRSPSPSANTPAPETRPRAPAPQARASQRAGRALGLPGVTPTFLIRAESGAPSRQPGAGWGGSPARRQTRAQPQPQPPPSGRREQPVAASGPAPVRGPGTSRPGGDSPPRSPGTSGPNHSERHGRIFATRQV